MQDVTNRELRQIFETPELLAQLRDQLKLGAAGKISRSDGAVFITGAGPEWSPPRGGILRFSLEGRPLRIPIQKH